MRLRTIAVLVGLCAMVAAGAAAVRAVQRGAACHDVDDPTAPGSVDHWPPVPRRPSS